MTKKFLNDLIEVLISINDATIMRTFLKGLFSPKELEEISTRLEIVRRLKRGIPQHQIAKDLGVGVATVTRGSKELQKGRFKVLDEIETSIK